MTSLGQIGHNISTRTVKVVPHHTQYLSKEGVDSIVSSVDYLLGQHQVAVVQKATYDMVIGLLRGYLEDAGDISVSTQSTRITPLHDSKIPHHTLAAIEDISRNITTDVSYLLGEHEELRVAHTLSRTIAAHLRGYIEDATQ